MPSAIAQMLMNRTFSGIGREVGQNITEQNARSKRQTAWEQQQADRQRIRDAINSTPDFVQQLAEQTKQAYGERAQKLGVPLPDPSLFQTTGTKADLSSAKEFAEQVAIFKDTLDKTERDQQTRALEAQQIGTFQGTTPSGEYPRGEVARAIGAPATPRVQKMLESYPTTEPQDYQSFQGGQRLEVQGLALLERQRHAIAGEVARFDTQIRQLNQLQQKIEKGEFNPFLNPTDSQSLQTAGFTLDDFNSGKVTSETIAARKADMEVQSDVAKDRMKENRAATKEFIKAPGKGLASAISGGQQAAAQDDPRILEEVKQYVQQNMKSIVPPVAPGQKPDIWGAVTNTIVEELRRRGASTELINHIVSQRKSNVGTFQLTAPGQAPQKAPQQVPQQSKKDPLGIL